jgi:dipeptide transport system permease protein
MIEFIFRKIVMFFLTFLGVTILSFSFIRLLPGDPIILLAGERGIDDERYAQLKAQFGFDQPLLHQYFDFLTNVFQGDLGVSFVTKKPVWDEFFTLFPATVELSICAVLFAIAI